ncbi:MAG: bifunctional methylenetetrahydrofolate dehydrogenase/methenyltetrahydrofolate cyclohydrolase FolD [Clostridiaceae bacterium]|nr:bifunctional methylenetetrahydrofolate dehydrogenase/methenyltetrahydrofolate cyclohydrolase FolD [Clostridiaceae bacterium]
MSQIIDGKAIAANLRLNIKDQIKEQTDKDQRPPGLDVILVGEDPASKIYVRNKKLACEQVGIISQIHHLPEDTHEEDLLNLIQDLNQDSSVDGILCQLPLPSHISEAKVIETISPEKDVDGFHPINSGRVFAGSDGFSPCTPAGIIQMLKSIKFDFIGKNAVVIGRSNIVGKPMAILLLNENCTVTIAHSKTKNLAAICQKADLLVTSAGQRDFVTKDFTNENQVIIDVSINRNDEGQVVGDVKFEEVAPHVKAITPVPGGVGPMTIAMLLKNTLDSYLQKQANHQV